MTPASKLRVIILALLLALFVAALPVSAEGGESEKPPETIKLSIYQTDLWDYTPLLQTYVDEISPNVEINIHSFPIWEYEEKIKIAIASGDTPDLFLFPNWIIPSFSSIDGLLTDLNEINSNAISEIREGTVQGPWDTVNSPARESVYFVPLNSSPTVLYYRTDLFRKAGLPTNPDAVESKLNSWNAVASLGKAYKSKTNRSLLGQPIDIFDSIVQLKAPAYFNNKGQYVGDKNPQIKKAFDYVAKAMKEGWIGKLDDESGTLEKAVKSGSVGAVLGGPDIGQSLQEWMPKLAGKWAVASVPEGTTDSGILSAAIPAMKSNTASTMELIRWLSGAQAQNLAYNQFGFFPANLEALSETEWLNEKDAYFGNQQVNRWYVEAVQTARPFTLYQNSTFDPHAIFKNAITRLIRNVKSNPVQEWAAALKEVKKEALKK